MKTSLLTLTSLLAVAAASNYQLVAYWGQNGVYNRHKDPQNWERELDYFCKNYKYDVIVVAFNHIFFDSGNKGSLPGLNFAYHCDTPLGPEYPSLLRCPTIEEGIKECQKRGKKVLLSMGGAAGAYGFTSDSKAKEYAHTIWNLFLEGTKMQGIRPFGSAIMDGVDLDIEGGTHIGYTAFVRELRALSATSSRKYIIAAAPQCPFPDAYLGPMKGKAFGDVAPMFDEIYIQFYNNYCQTGKKQFFWETMNQWLAFSEKSNGPKIFVGVPAGPGGSYNDADYRTPDELRALFQDLRKKPRFGGFMLWDAGFDQNNVIGGKSYSEHLVDILSQGGVQPPPTQQPPLTQRPPKTGVVTDKVPKPTKPATISCQGLADGIYAHPTDCSKFFQCHAGIPYVKACSPGLVFNPLKKFCDWPANVQC